MKTVVMEYEKTVTMLVAEKENSSCANTDSLSELARERDQALEDLQSVETAFSDLHRRFEKSKSTVEAFKKNEETLKKCVSDYQTKLKKQEEKYQSLKHLAEDRLSTSHEAFENYKRSTKGDITRLELALRKAELEVKTLQQTVEQKTNENAELTNICDELLNKVGSE
ncbi:hypothetical protein CAPTEDRAFT_167820 [Capitella teleta]|uniref:Transforming acidic coiled-coil-containing protein C-terminal domain-containing protein n=1 Tax=Capitella teleta TaxID=283909 RepID=R7U3G4_CAPTE|nr:hypothetical protein CAPTEDRAFT_167820 [Capitella teleta]|eukprot:ELT97715.1 hypothetical protein CAPTEDRAFT_167820 [Capitella teleta]